ncbi:MAG TPA: S1 RNA-binding domain-containing protein, partial [Rubrobacter sp.]|nr:S1 RNA-binding domain-containing protein [Rubrobacter sp.]
NLLIFFMPSFYVAIDSRILNGRVTRVEDGGCYFVDERGNEGYIPRKELAGEPARSAQEMVTPGEAIKYKVLGVDGGGGYRYSSRKADEGAFVTRLFTVTRLEYAMLLEHDLIKVTCYPHSSTVERVERYDDIEKKFIPATDGATI